MALPTVVRFASVYLYKEPVVLDKIQVVFTQKALLHIYNLNSSTLKLSASQSRSKQLFRIIFTLRYPSSPSEDGGVDNKSHSRPEGVSNDFQIEPNVPCP